MSSKNVKAKKALRQATWHRNRQTETQTPTHNYPSTANPQTPQQTEKKKKLTPRQILSLLAFQDHENKDRIFTVESEDIINKKMQAILGYIQPLAVDYGEVLNRPGEKCWWLSRNDAVALPEKLY